MARVTTVLRAFVVVFGTVLVAAGPAVGQTTVCGTISSDTTWTLAGSPYVATCNVYVQGSSNPILTIEPGVEVRFQFNGALWIGWSGQGGLQAVGTPGERILFTTDRSPQVPGEWDGIRFGSQVDPASRIVSADIEYAGGDDAFPGVFMAYNDATATLEDVAFSNTVGHDVSLRFGSNFTGTGCTLGSVRYWDYTVQSSWTGNTFVDWGAVQSVLTPHGANAIGNGNSILPVAGATADLLSGTVREDLSMPAGPGPYLVQGYLYVHDATNNPVLTLEPGVELRFDSGDGFYVGYSGPGDLVTQAGTAPVVLTSSAGTPVPGSWTGLILGTLSNGLSDLRNLHIEYAGGSGSWPGAFYVAAAATLDDVTFTDNDRHDIYLADGADIDVSNSTLSGFYYGGASALARWNGNQFLNWGKTRSRVVLGDVGSLSHGNVFHPVSGGGVDLVGSTVEETAIWGPAPGPYYPSAYLRIQHTINNPQLTLEPGVEIRFPAGETFYVGYNYPGRLVADGGVDPIILTSSAPAPAPGDWHGVFIGSQAMIGTLLRNVRIEYAGGSSAYPGAVYAYYNDGATLDNVSFANNDRHDIYLAQNSNLDVLGSTLSSFRYQNYTVTASWDGNVFYDWGETTSVVSLEGADAVSHGNTFQPVPDARLELFGGTLRQDASWSSAPGPYFLNGILYVQDSVNDPTLTLEPGVEIQVAAARRIVAGYSYTGGFDFNGVLFTSASATPAPGDWDFVQIGDHGRGNLDGVTFEYADTGLDVLNPAVTLNDLRFAHSSIGLDLDAAVTTPISGLRFDDVDTAVQAYGAPVRILDSEIVGNVWGVENLTPGSVVDVRDNWWGAADGPSGNGTGSGAAITAGVLYDPVLTAPVYDCDADGTSDTCEINCGQPGGLCDVPECGTQSDADGNWIPDDCDLGGRVGLTFDATHMHWTEVPPALGYDMIHGDLYGLLEVGGDFAEATNGCQFNDETGTSALQGPDPLPGEAWFYLLRTEMPTETESYDVQDSNQVGSRDPEILASGNDCAAGG